MQLLARTPFANRRAPGTAILLLYWHFAPNQERFVKAEDLLTGA